MKRLYSLLRNSWLRVQLKAPPFAQRVLIPRLHQVKEIVRLLTRVRLPVYRWEGQGTGGALVVSYAGLAYTKAFLQDLLFEADPVEQQVGRVPFWRRRELASLGGDLVIVEAPEPLVTRLSRHNAFIVPEHVHHALDVRGDWQDLRLRFHRTVRDNELRLVRKYGYEYKVSDDDRDFDTFYYQMYLPTMKSRHGELSSPMAFDEVYQYYKEGLLLCVKRDDVWVSGIVCYLQQNVVIAKAAGIMNGDQNLLREGAASTLYYAAIHWAHQNGCRAVNFLGSGARLNGGLFQYKRKWGTAVSVPPDLHRRIWIKVKRVTPAVSRFLKDNPFIVLDDKGELHGLVIVDDVNRVSPQTRKKWEKRYFTPGLSSLWVRSVGDLAEMADWSAGLVIAIPSDFGQGNKQ